MMLFYTDQKYPDDCMIACLVMLMERHYTIAFQRLYEAVNRCVNEKREWYTLIEGWCLANGYQFYWLVKPDEAPKDKLYIAGGASPRPDVPDGHAVVMRNGELVHDPHTSRAGLAGPVEEVYWVEKL